MLISENECSFTTKGKKAHKARRLASIDGYKHLAARPLPMAGNVSHVPAAMAAGERHQPADKREN
jgi:hypothetical protein